MSERVRQQQQVYREWSGASQWGQEGQGDARGPGGIGGPVLGPVGTLGQAGMPLSRVWAPDQLDIAPYSAQEPAGCWDESGFRYLGKPGSLDSGQNHSSVWQSSSSSQLSIGWSPLSRSNSDGEKHHQLTMMLDDGDAGAAFGCLGSSSKNINHFECTRSIAPSASAADKIWCSGGAEVSSPSSVSSTNSPNQISSSSSSSLSSSIVSTDTNNNAAAVIKPVSSLSVMDSAGPTQSSLLSAFTAAVAATTDPGGTPATDAVATDTSAGQTWAQAAGKGLAGPAGPGAPSSQPGAGASVSERMEAVINEPGGWGSHTVDQSTPWPLAQLVSDGPWERAGSLDAADPESNVWASEPPTGVAVWESHYHAASARAKPGAPRTGWAGVAKQPPIAEDPPSPGAANAHSHSQIAPSPATGSSGSSCGSSAGHVVSSAAGLASATHDLHNHQQHNQQQQQYHHHQHQQHQQQQQQHNHYHNNHTHQTALNANPDPISMNSRSQSIHNHIQHQQQNSFYQNPNMGMAPPNNRTSVGSKSKQMMSGGGFRKEECGQMITGTGSMFNSSMEMGRAPGPTGHGVGMLGARGDWGMSNDNYHLQNQRVSAVNSIDSSDNNLSGNSAMVLGQSVINGQSMKPNHMMQQMQQQQMQQQQQQSIGPGRMGTGPPDNAHSSFFEKQILAEIAQLQSKEQELVQRISGFRSISGSQAFIQEMTRTLNEVRQQLSTQQKTLKVIRSQNIMTASANGLVHNPSIGLGNNTPNNQFLSMPSSRPPMQSQAPGLQAQQSQQQAQLGLGHGLGLSSDLSAQMSELKLQKNRMDLWPGNLPSPSTISPFIGADKTAGFYNPSIPNGGPMPPSQSFNNFTRTSMINNNNSNTGVSSHRQSNQIWQSRMMQPSSAGNSIANTDSLSIINTGSGVPDEMIDPIANSNPSSNPKLQMTSYCAAGDSTTRMNNNSNNSANINHHSTANSANTTALSLSQTLSSSIGNRVSSAFTSSRDISHISANISEFVPGQPWPGVNYSQRDDSNVTLGAGPRSLLSITNDHLEKLTNPSVNSLLNGPNDVGVNISSVNRCLPNSLNGVCSSGGGARVSMTYVLIRDLPSHINIEMIKAVFTPHHFPGISNVHPNLTSRWVLLHFSSYEDALKASKSLYNNKVGVVELLSDQEVGQVMRGGHRNNGIVDYPMMF